MISVSGLVHVTLRESLQGEMSRVALAFQGLLWLFRRDFNVTLQAGDRPYRAGERDPSSEAFWSFVSGAAQVKMGHTGCVYAYSTAGPNSLSRLDRFMCLMALIKCLPKADVQSLPRPLLYHSPIKYQTHKGNS